LDIQSPELPDFSGASQKCPRHNYKHPDHRADALMGCGCCWSTCAICMERPCKTEFSGESED
jgi:hypothetical protein